nr:hypothetical protein [Tanacetum cinerariifolium]
MAAAADLNEIKEVNANCILLANLQQASTSGTQTNKAPVYDSDGSVEVHDYENCNDNEIFNMFTQEEQYTELLEPIPEPHQVPQNNNNIISEDSNMEQKMGKNSEKNAVARKLAALMLRENDGKIVGKDGKPLRMDIHYPNYVNPNSGQSLNGKPKTGIANPRSGGSVLNGENTNPNLNNVSRKVDTTQPVISTSVLEIMETGNTSTLTSENNTRVSPIFENPNDVNLTDQLGNETQIVDNIWGTTEVNENHEGLNTKSFVNVVTGTKPNSKINFRTLFNEERVENSNFVLPMENVVAAKNKFANSLVGFFIAKRVAFPLGRMGFARALIEVDADRNLKEEVVMAVPRLEGEGHTIETMKVKYEWKPPRCSDCLVFGHNNSECPKCVVEIPKETIEASDGFTMVQNRRKKGKNVANGVQKNVNAELKASDKELAMKIMNHFLALQDENITHHTNASDASTSDVQAENGATNVVDDDNEVEDLGNKYEVTKIKIGASTHPIKFPNV